MTLYLFIFKPNILAVLVFHHLLLLPHSRKPPCSNQWIFQGDLIHPICQQQPSEWLLLPV